MKKPLSSPALYAGFILWGVGALTSFADRQVTPMTYTLELLGLVCILVHYCVRNEQTKNARTHVARMRKYQ